MIKFNVIYPHKDGARFDHDYYREKHLPMLAERLGEACIAYSIDKGLAGREPGSPSPFLASCSVLCESVEKLQRALEPHTHEIRADVKNYTDVTPVVWISDVVVGQERP